MTYRDLQRSENTNCLEKEKGVYIDHERIVECLYRMLRPFK